MVALLGVDVYDQQLYRLRTGFIRFLVISLLLVTASGLFLGAQVAKIIARPLDQLVQGMKQEELALIASHHEREDGTGYPKGLDRSKISDLVAIVSVADAYDAMTSHRPYRHAMPAGAGAGRASPGGRDAVPPRDGGSAGNRAGEKRAGLNLHR